MPRLAPFSKLLLPAADAAGVRSMSASHRIWWLIAFCALAIGVAIEADAPAEPPAAESSAAAAAPASLAARARLLAGA